MTRASANLLGSPDPGNGGSSNGKTADSDSACLGSNPSPPATQSCLNCCLYPLPLQGQKRHDISKAYADASPRCGALAISKQQVVLSLQRSSSPSAESRLAVCKKGGRKAHRGWRAYVGTISDRTR